MLVVSDDIRLENGREKTVMGIDSKHDLNADRATTVVDGSGIGTASIGFALCNKENNMKIGLAITRIYLRCNRRDCDHISL